MAGQQAENGLGSVFILLVAINVFVGLFNMIPLLPFDGGHVSVAVYEAIRTRLQKGRRYMAEGKWVIMFPEGTRSPRGGKGTYKVGGTRLAVETGHPVLPIAVTSARCWPRKSFVLSPGVIDVSIGKPIASAGRTADELMREVETWIEAEMRRLDPQAYEPGGEPAVAAA